LNVKTTEKNWSADENKLLLELHSTHLNRWKLIAAHVPGRLGGQVKNQFFNIVRTLLRKAFKLGFRRCETLTVSEIKPKVLSEIVNKNLGHFLPNLGAMAGTTIKQFLLDETGFRQASQILKTIKESMISIK